MTNYYGTADRIRRGGKRTLIVAKVSFLLQCLTLDNNSRFILTIHIKYYGVCASLPCRYVSTYCLATQHTVEVSTWYCTRYQAYTGTIDFEKDVK